MKYFKKQILHFLIYFIIISLIVFFSINYLINSKGNFKIGSNYSTYIMGHSHAEFAYNDSLIKNAKNISNSAEPYFYTFSKLKKLSEINPELKLILLEFSNNSISKAMEDWIYEERYLNHRFTFYAPFLEFQQFRILISKSPIITFENFFKSIVNNFWKLIRNDLNYSIFFGKYSGLDKQLSSEPKIEFVAEKESLISQNNLQYLKKIISLCKERNIKIIFIRTPQHDSCSELANELTFQKTYDNNFSEIPFLDLQGFPLEIKDYADAEHLNIHGAKKVSIWLNQKIKEGKIKTLLPGKNSFKELE